MALNKFIAAQLRRPSGFFGRFVGPRFFNRANAQIHAYALEHLDVQPGETVLDVGFGGGLALEQIAMLVDGGRVVGVDLSPEMVRQARRRFASLIEAGTLQIEEADAAALPFDAETFDKALTVNTIFFFPDPVACLREIRRVLKPGGWLVVGFRSREKMQGFGFTKHGFTLYAPDDGRRLLGEAGFKNCRIDHRDREETLDSVLAIAEA